jgi:hypothetical protein
MLFHLASLAYYPYNECIAYTRSMLEPTRLELRPLQFQQSATSNTTLSRLGALQGLRDAAPYHTRYRTNATRANRAPTSCHHAIL